MHVIGLEWTPWVGGLCGIPWRLTDLDDLGSCWYLLVARRAKEPLLEPATVTVKSHMPYTCPLLHSS